MQRLDFRLPSFCRVCWVSTEARRVWRPRLDRVRSAIPQIERQSVPRLRRAAISDLSQDRLADVLEWCARRNLAAVPLALRCRRQSLHGHRVEPSEGLPLQYEIGIAPADDVEALRAAHSAADSTRLGDLLGYPTCCQRFFQERLASDAITDPIWIVARQDDEPDARTCDVAGPLEANILLHAVGVRAIPHIPCSFACEESARLGRRILELGRAGGFREEMDWLEEMLAWPIEWSSLHGIAEVKLPIAKIALDSDATAVTYAVRRSGDQYPAEGARGLHFPFQPPSRPKLTESRVFRRGLNVLRDSPS